MQKAKSVQQTFKLEAVQKRTQLEMHRVNCTIQNSHILLQLATQWAKRGLHVSLPLLEQTWLHIHLSRRTSNLYLVNSIRATTLGEENCYNIKMILICLPNKFMTFSVGCSDVPVAMRGYRCLGPIQAHIVSADPIGICRCVANALVDFQLW